jgi:hypothetical protein
VVPNLNPEIPIEAPYIELASFEPNVRQAEIPAPAYVPDMAAPFVQPPTIYIHSQGRITTLLADANREPLDPQAEPLRANMRNDEGCTSHRIENAMNGIGCGGGIGLIMKVMCGTNLVSAIGCAGLWATFFFCYNPPLLRDCLQSEAIPQPAPRRN